MRNRYLPFIAVAFVLLIAGSVAAVAEDDENNPPSSGAAQVATIEPEAKNALDALNKSRVSGDALPEEFAARMKERASFGMNPALSRRVIGNMTSSVYLIPARGHVCASLTDSKGATVICPTTDEVAEGKSGPGTVSLDTGGIAIYGVVPDGVDEVSIQTGTSDSTDVATENNAYYTVVPAGTPLRTVSYTGPSGRVEFPIYDPAVALEGS